MEKLTYCSVEKKAVDKEHCKDCKQKQEEEKFRVCRSAVRQTKCPKCGEVFE